MNLNNISRVRMVHTLCTEGWSKLSLYPSSCPATREPIKKLQTFLKPIWQNVRWWYSIQHETLISLTSTYDHKLIFNIHYTMIWKGKNIKSLLINERSTRYTFSSCKAPRETFDLDLLLLSSKNTNLQIMQERGMIAREKVGGVRVPISPA